MNSELEKIIGKALKPRLMKGEQIRLIETNTQARSLFVLAEILRHINGEIPKFILEEDMVNWSSKEEESNREYKESQGKLTENGQKTKAFKYYVKLAEKLELIFLIGQTIQLTKFGEIFCLAFPERNIRESLFFWHWLLKYDSDNLLTIWKILINNGAARLNNGVYLGKKPDAVNKSRIRGAEKASILR